MHIHRLTLFIDRFLLVSATYPPACQALNWQHKPNKSEAMEEVVGGGGDQGHFVMTSTKARGLKTVPHISRVYIWRGWQIPEGILRRAKEYSSPDEIWCLNLIWQLETVWQPRFIFSTRIGSFSVMESIFWNQKKRCSLRLTYISYNAQIAAVSKRLSFTDNAFKIFCFCFKLGRRKHSNSNTCP